MSVTRSIAVTDEGQNLTFTFGDMLRYSGPGSPAGVAVAFKAMEVGFPALSPGAAPARREIVIETAFRGPGARDAFELVSRGLTDGRYLVTGELERPERGTTLSQFVFRIGYRARSVTLLVRHGLIADEFIALARRTDRTPDDELRFTEMKRLGADQLMALEAGAVFEPFAVE